MTARWNRPHTSGQDVARIVGVSEGQDAAATLSRAREALGHAERQGGPQVAMAGASA
jgi:hypothetical protein